MVEIQHPPTQDKRTHIKNAFLGYLDLSSVSSACIHWLLNAHAVTQVLQRILFAAPPCFLAETHCLGFFGRTAALIETEGLSSYKRLGKAQISCLATWSVSAVLSLFSRPVQQQARHDKWWKKKQCQACKPLRHGIQYTWSMPNMQMYVHLGPLRGPSSGTATNKL